MGSAAAGLLLAAALVTAVACLGAWALLRRPARQLQRRQRAAALAAAARGATPAARGALHGRGLPSTPSAKGQEPAPPDPAAPGLSDAERVAAMRALLKTPQGAALDDASPVTTPSDEIMTTSPMAWRPTLPPDEMERLERQLPRARRRPRSTDQDHEHVTLS